MRSGDDVASAYAHCAWVTRTQARNFSYGIRLLPPPKRAALSAVYALARRIDDIGDSAEPSQDKKAALDDVRESLRDLDGSTDPVLVAVADASKRFPIPLGALDELVDGVAMDVETDATGRRYQDIDDVVTYCRCVAGSVGRLCLGIFGTRHGTGDADEAAKAAAYADTLGIALQQINILRDIREDLGNGRVYIPQVDLDRFDVRLAFDEHGRLNDEDGRTLALIRHLVGRARDWYDRGQRLVPMLDGRSAACCTAMAGIYYRVLDRIAAEPRLVLEQRVSLPGWQKAMVAARALARGLS